MKEQINCFIKHPAAKTARTFSEQCHAKQDLRSLSLQNMRNSAHSPEI